MVRSLLPEPFEHNPVSQYKSSMSTFFKHFQDEDCAMVDVKNMRDVTMCLIIKRFYHAADSILTDQL